MSTETDASELEQDDEVLNQAEDQDDDQDEIQINPLEMSDEDIEKMPMPRDAAPKPAEGDSQTVDEDDADASPPGEDSAEDEDQTEKASEAVSGDAEDDEADKSDDDEPLDKAADKAASGKEGDTDAKLDESEKPNEPKPVTAEEQLATLFSPFKANGKQMQVTTVADAMTLMQMGANYNKKMAGMKPNLKLMKMLDKNGLLDEAKLTYLIDLEKKNPEAIKKLLQDTETDPLEIDLEKKADYTPGTYTVTEEEVNLDSVLEDIQDTPTFNATIDAITTKWDAASKDIAINEPEVIKTINDHMSAGIYDEIMGIVANEKALGRFAGVSDIEAYRKVGEDLQAAGAFAPKPANTTPAANENIPPVPKKAVDPKLNSRKKAAAPSKSSKAPTKAGLFNPLEMSDEEFDKLAAPIF